MAKQSWSAWPNRREGAVIVAFWAMLTLILLTGRVFGLEEGTREIEWFAVARIVTRYFVWALLTPCIFWLAARYMLDRSTLSQTLPVHLTIALLVSIAAHIGVLSLCTYVLPVENPCPFRPLRSITGFAFINEFMMYSAILATGFARVYYRRQREGEAEAQALRMQKAELEAQLSKAHLDALRMQLNPHFLFNTLHSISTLVDTDPRGVRRMIARLSDLLRYVLEENETQEVPLHREMEFLHHYLDIQQVRFEGRLLVDTHVDPEVEKAMVPTFILQPIVENALEHVAEQHPGRTCIVIRAWREENVLVLSVSDNGGGKDSEVDDITLGTGLSNVRGRLKALYGTSQALAFRKADEGGLEVVIRLPFHVEDDLFASAHDESQPMENAQSTATIRHDE